MIPKRVCVLVSGGIDSTALLSNYLHAARSVAPIYVRSGYPWEKAELYWLRRILAALRSDNLMPLTILTLPAAELHRRGDWAISGRHVPGARSDDASVYLPGRNILLLAKAAVFCARNGISQAAIGTLKGNPFPDARATFFSQFGRACSTGLAAKFAILAPFSALTKRQVMERFKGLPWKITFSCLSPTGHAPCGRCNKCAERRRALTEIL